MSETPSTMLSLGTRAPDFRLPDPDGKMYSLADFADAPALVVMFLCNHCPYVKHVRHHLAELTREFRQQGVAVVGINSNDFRQYPDDRPEAMKKEALLLGYQFPYLVDESQEVARAYRAACTPDFYVFDRERELVYRGQMDGSRPGNDVPVTGTDLKAAVQAALAGETIPESKQRPSLGCNIKWKPGNEPDYFG